MWQDGIGFATPLEDKTKSKIFGKVGYGVFPKGPKAQHSAMFGDGIGVSSYSKKKGPAYYYCLWATNKVNQLRVLQAGAAVPPRSSALSNPDRAQGSTMPGEYFECLEGSGKILRAGLPEIIPVTEFRDIFGIALTNIIGGADPAADVLAARQAIRIPAGQPEVLEAELLGLRSAEDWLGVAGYLQTLPVLRGFEVREAEGDRLRLRLDLAVDRARFEALLAAGRRLEVAAPGEDAEGRPLARYRVPR